MQAHSKLFLGCVQLGMKYGIRKRNYKPPTELEVQAILHTAARHELRGLDTAFEYGDSEALIGRYRPSAWQPAIITKTPKLRPGRFFANTRKLIEKAFEISMANLGTDRCTALLVHDADNVLQPGGQYLVEALLHLKEQGKVSKVGVSVYTASQVERVRQMFDFDIVQLPFSLADQRLLADGTATELHRQGVEVHVRSVFLQGALLMEDAEVLAGMAGLIPMIHELKRRSRAVDRTPIEVLLSFALQQPWIDAVVCGVNRAEHVRELAEASRVNLSSAFDASPLPLSDPDLLNPATWTSRINL